MKNIYYSARWANNGANWRFLPVVFVFEKAEVIWDETENPEAAFYKYKYTCTAAISR
jgi:hypothetical protein